MKNAVEILRARGIGLSLTNEGTLSITCGRPLTSEQQRWLSGHKAELVAGLRASKATMGEALVRLAEARGWEVEFVNLKDEVPPLPKEIRHELVTERGFPQHVVDRMSHSEAAFFLFRDGAAEWR
ncbi:MAG: hypothetical protein H0V18_16450 [Pyrinomonadaceae bacterium]|jgi:hypothetical protein|nr:hypothetical protein [Pyrinomonadaceae bacterium]